MQAMHADPEYPITDPGDNRIDSGCTQASIAALQPISLHRVQMRLRVLIAGFGQA
ncbi:hypothetical protein GGR61_000485 [Xanthomonas arboricola]|nr:hypothetical protein [Xanthomonas sp. 3075]MBB5862899.1 hypothetical protein [Xanthomonas sp. 3058]